MFRHAFVAPVGQNHNSTITPMSQFEDPSTLAPVTPYSDATLNLPFHLETRNPIPVGLVPTAMNVQLASAELLAHHPYHRRLNKWVIYMFLTTATKALRDERAVASKRMKTVADKPPSPGCSRWWHVTQ